MRIQLIENVNEGTVDYNMQLWFFFFFLRTRVENTDPVTPLHLPMVTRKLSKYTLPNNKGLKQTTVTKNSAHMLDMHQVQVRGQEKK